MLTNTKTDKIDWNKGFKLLAYAYNERTHVLCPSMLVWCSLHVTHDDDEDNVYVAWGPVRWFA